MCRSPWWPFLGLLSGYPLLRQVNATHLKIGHLEIFSTGAPSSNELQCFVYMRGYTDNKLGNGCQATWPINKYDDVIKGKHFPRYWPFVRGIHRSRWIPLTKANVTGLWCFLYRINGWLNNHEDGDLRRHRAHYDVTAMWKAYMHITSLRVHQSCICVMEK